MRLRDRVAWALLAVAIMLVASCGEAAPIMGEAQELGEAAAPGKAAGAAAPGMVDIGKGVLIPKAIADLAAKKPTAPQAVRAPKIVEPSIHMKAKESSAMHKMAALAAKFNIAAPAKAPISTAERMQAGAVLDPAGHPNGPALTPSQVLKSAPHDLGESNPGDPIPPAQLSPDGKAAAAYRKAMYAGKSHGQQMVAASTALLKAGGHVGVGTWPFHGKVKQTEATPTSSLEATVPMPKGSSEHHMGADGVPHERLGEGNPYQAIVAAAKAKAKQQPNLGEAPAKNPYEEMVAAAKAKAAKAAKAVSPAVADFRAHGATAGIKLAPLLPKRPLAKDGMGLVPKQEPIYSGHNVKLTPAAAVKRQLHLLKKAEKRFAGKRAAEVLGQRIKSHLHTHHLLGEARHTTARIGLDALDTVHDHSLLVRQHGKDSTTWPFGHPDFGELDASSLLQQGEGPEADSVSSQHQHHWNAGWARRARERRAAQEPHPDLGESAGVASKITDLEQRKKTAVEGEHYHLAAKLKDQIKALQEQQSRRPPAEPQHPDLGESAEIHTAPAPQQQPPQAEYHPDAEPVVAVAYDPVADMLKANGWGAEKLTQGAKTQTTPYAQRSRQPEAPHEAVLAPQGPRGARSAQDDGPDLGESAAVGPSSPVMGPTPAVKGTVKFPAFPMVDDTDTNEGELSEAAAGRQESDDAAMDEATEEMAEEADAADDELSH
jgi:hypothetical protein